MKFNYFQKKDYISLIEIQFFFIIFNYYTFLIKYAQHENLCCILVLAIPLSKPLSLSHTNTLKWIINIIVRTLLEKKIRKEIKINFLWNTKLNLVCIQLWCIWTYWGYINASICISFKFLKKYRGCLIVLEKLHGKLNWSFLRTLIRW